jgi:hypothetical protein
MKVSLTLAALFLSFLIVAVNVQPVLAARPATSTPVAIEFSFDGAAIKQGNLVSPPGTPANPCDYQGRTAIFHLESAGEGAVDFRGVAKGTFTAYAFYAMADFYDIGVCVPGDVYGEPLYDGLITGTWKATYNPSTGLWEDFSVQFSNKHPTVHGMLTTRIMNPVAIDGLNGYIVIGNKAWISGAPAELIYVDIFPYP